MPSMKSVIMSHNAKVLKIPEPQNPRACNCNNAENCPLEGNCLIESIVYDATVQSAGNEDERTYYGTVEGPFKGRVNTHRTSFRHRKYEKSTKLSEYVWCLKDNDTPSTIKWSVAKKSHPYTCGTRKCDLCLSEKLLIAQGNPAKLLNKRDELISKCRHRNKFTLTNFKNR